MGGGRGRGGWGVKLNAIYVMEICVQRCECVRACKMSIVYICRYVYRCMCVCVMNCSGVWECVKECLGVCRCVWRCVVVCGVVVVCGSA